MKPARLPQFLPAIFLGVLLTPGPAQAGPLQATRVPAAAKWILHVDLEDALRSQVGTLLATEVVDRSLARPLRDLKEKHGLEMDWRRLKSITAFGNEVTSRPDEDGVLLLQGGVNFPAMLDKILEDLGSTGPLAKQGAAGRARYTLNEEVHGAEAPGGLFVLSRSQARLDESLATLGGRGAALGANPRFNRIPTAAGGFLYFGLAEGLGNLSDLPQAALLQQAIGGQLVAGEKGGQAFASLQLQTKDAAAAAQLHQVLQGLVLLGQLNQNGNPDLLPLLRATKLATNQANVSVSLQFPATNLTSRLARELRKAVP